MASGRNDRTRRKNRILSLKALAAEAKQASQANHLLKQMVAFYDAEPLLLIDREDHRRFYVTWLWTPGLIKKNSHESFDNEFSSISDPEDFVVKAIDLVVLQADIEKLSV